MRIYDCACTTDCTPPVNCTGCGSCAPVIVQVPSAPPEPVAVRAFNAGEQTTVGGTPLTYGASALISQKSAVVGTDSIVLNEAGIYMVGFNATASTGQGVTPPADLTLQLNSNGTPVDAALGMQSFTAENTSGTVSFMTLVTVAQGTPQTLTVVPDASDFTVSNASLTVAKIGS